jgi:GNAT superfamily N-acetyltransferase
MLVILTQSSIKEVVELTKELNPELDKRLLIDRHQEMFSYPNYYLFGYYLDDKLVGVMSAWETTRLYSGKQLELDNVVVTEKSKGIGTKFMEAIEAWAKERDYLTIELNTYTQNTKSHKFYYSKGFDILGFHFLKKI